MKCSISTGTTALANLLLLSPLFFCFCRGQKERKSYVSVGVFELNSHRNDAETEICLQNEIEHLILLLYCVNTTVGKNKFFSLRGGFCELLRILCERVLRMINPGNAGIVSFF